MTWNELLKLTQRKIIFMIVFIFVILFFLNALMRNMGAPNYLQLPFPVLLLTCSSMTCTNFSFNWIGLILSLVFWFFMYISLSYLFYLFKIDR